MTREGGESFRAGCSCESHHPSRRRAVHHATVLRGRPTHVGFIHKHQVRRFIRQSIAAPVRRLDREHQDSRQMGGALCQLIHHRRPVREHPHSLPCGAVCDGQVFSDP